jgi:hypothetical protein
MYNPRRGFGGGARKVMEALLKGADPLTVGGRFLPGGRASLLTQAPCAKLAMILVQTICGTTGSLREPCMEEDLKCLAVWPETRCLHGMLLMAAPITALAACHM